MSQRSTPMPRRVQQRIMQRWARGERPLVVAGHGDKPTKVYGYDDYQKMVAHPKQHRPWEQRQRKRALDPIGAIDGIVLLPITRDQMYDEAAEPNSEPAESNAKRLLKDLLTVSRARKGVSTSEALELLY